MSSVKKVFWSVRYEKILKSALDKNIDSSSVTLDARTGSLLYNLNWLKKTEGSELETAAFMRYGSKCKVRENCVICPRGAK